MFEASLAAHFQAALQPVVLSTYACGVMRVPGTDQKITMFYDNSGPDRTAVLVML